LQVLALLACCGGLKRSSGAPPLGARLQHRGLTAPDQLLLRTHEAVRLP